MQEFIKQEIIDMMWAQDQDGLRTKYGCKCQSEHDASECLASIWNGCKYVELDD